MSLHVSSETKSMQKNQTINAPLLHNYTHAQTKSKSVSNKFFIIKEKTYYVYYLYCLLLEHDT